jgi:hypothetical protein
VRPLISLIPTPHLAQLIPRGNHLDGPQDHQ